jgi:hypothetical protein
VTRRSENQAPPDKLDTSEYFQQVMRSMQLSAACAIMGWNVF